MITRARRWAWRTAAVTLGLAALGLLLMGPYRQFLVASAAGSSAEDRPAPCLPGQTRPLLDSPHVSQAEAAQTRYNSDPPTSGPHYAFVTPTSIYSTPLADGLTIHALEHGHIVIQYSTSSPPSTVALLNSVARHYPADVILAPRPGLEGRALTAWGRIARLAEFDEDQIIAFVEALRGRYNHGWTRPDDC
jgi:hypothetical protein